MCVYPSVSCLFFWQLWSTSLPVCICSPFFCCLFIIHPWSMGIYCICLIINCFINSFLRGLKLNRDQLSPPFSSNQLLREATCSPQMLPPCIPLQDLNPPPPFLVMIISSSLLQVTASITLLEKLLSSTARSFRVTDTIPKTCDFFYHSPHYNLPLP